MNETTAMERYLEPLTLTLSIDEFRRLPSCSADTLPGIPAERGGVAIALGVVSATLLVTSLTGPCSIYGLLGGVSTLRKERANPEAPR